MTQQFRYTIEFRAEGVPESVLTDMARHDRAAIVARTDNADGRAVSATFQGRLAPTMERWATFWVGARISQGPDLLVAWVVDFGSQAGTMTLEFAASEDRAAAHEAAATLLARTVTKPEAWQVNDLKRG